GGGVGGGSEVGGGGIGKGGCGGRGRVGGLGSGWRRPWARRRARRLAADDDRGGSEPPRARRSARGCPDRGDRGSGGRDLGADRPRAPRRGAGRPPPPWRQPRAAARPELGGGA